MRKTLLGRGGLFLAAIDGRILLRRHLLNGDHMKLLFSLLLLGMCALSAFAQIPKIEPGVSHELAVWRATNYSDVHYKLYLTLEKMSPVLKGTIEIRVTTEAGEGEHKMGAQYFNVNPIILDWSKVPGHEKDFTISNVTLNGYGMQSSDSSQPYSYFEE